MIGCVAFSMYIHTNHTGCNPCTKNCLFLTVAEFLGIAILITGYGHGHGHGLELHGCRHAEGVGMQRLGWSLELGMGMPWWGVLQSSEKVNLPCLLTAWRSSSLPA